MNKILLIPSNGNQVKLFSMIIKELSRYKAEISVLCVDEYKNENSEQMLKVYFPIYKKIGQYKRNNCLKVAEIFFYMIDYLINILLRKSSADSNYFVSPNRLRIIAKAVLSIENPDLIILGNDSCDLEKAFFWNATKKNISSLLIQDGLIDPLFQGDISDKRRRNSSYLRNIIMTILSFMTGKKSVSWGNGLNYGVSGATRIAVWSKSTKEALKKRGIAEDKIVVTGNPMFDRVISANYPPRDEIYRRLNIEKDKEIIVFATSESVDVGIITAEEMRLALSQLVGVIQKIPKKHLVIKIHPCESLETYNQYLGKYKDSNNVTIIKDIDLYGLLNVCEFVITEMSTVGLEGIIFDKPLLILNFFNNKLLPNARIYIDADIAVVASKHSDLFSAVEEALRDSALNENLKRNRQKFIAIQGYPIDGQNSKRVAELIVTMVQNRFN